MLHKLKSWLTLTELFIVTVIIAALTVAVFVALNPVERLREAKNARRTNDVDSISNAIHASIIENKGVYPTGLTPGMAETQIGTATGGCTISTGNCNATAAQCINLMKGEQNLSKYLKTMPVDPEGGFLYSQAKTGYSVSVDASGIVVVRACGADKNGNIVSSR